MKVLGLYPWPGFWSLGARSGANSFFLAPQSFVRFGHEIHISMPAEAGRPLREDDEGIHLHRFRGAIRFDSNASRPMPVRLTSRFVRYVYYLVIATWNGVRLGRKLHPDLVIGYGVHGAAAASLTARLLRVPNITRLFGLQLPLYLHSRLKRPGAFMDYFALKAPASYIIIHNDGSEGDRVARLLGVPAERIRFWRDGYEASLTCGQVPREEMKRSLGIPEAHVVLFCVGRITDDKRMGRLIEILPRVLEEAPETTLMLVGDGADREACERRAEELGVRPRVVFTGAVSRDRLPDYLGVGDIFVGVSDRTNVNLAPLEAMSCGKPMVALDTGGTREIVKEGWNGLLVARERWREDLVPALLRLIRDGDLRRRMGEAARESVLREIPTLEERQRMEVELAVQAVAEFRSRS